MAIIDVKDTATVHGLETLQGERHFVVADARSRYYLLLESKPHSMSIGPQLTSLLAHEDDQPRPFRVFQYNDGTAGYAKGQLQEGAVTVLERVTSDMGIATFDISDDWKRTPFQNGLFELAKGISEGSSEVVRLGSDWLEEVRPHSSTTLPSGTWSVLEEPSQQAVYQRANLLPHGVFHSKYLPSWSIERHVMRMGSDLREALEDLKGVRQEAEEAGLPIPPETVITTAEQLLKAIYFIYPQRIEVYPTPDGEVAIDVSGGFGSSFMLLCDPDGSVLYLLNIRGHSTRKRYADPNLLPHQELREGLSTLKSGTALP